MIGGNAGDGRGGRSKASVSNFQFQVCFRSVVRLDEIPSVYLAVNADHTTNELAPVRHVRGGHSGRWSSMDVVHDAVILFGLVKGEGDDSRRRQLEAVTGMRRMTDKTGILVRLQLGEDLGLEHVSSTRRWPKSSAYLPITFFRYRRIVIWATDSGDDTVTL